MICELCYLLKSFATNLDQISPTKPRRNVYLSDEYVLKISDDKIPQILTYAVKQPHSHCAGVATVHPDAGQPVYRDAPGHIS